MRKRHSRNAVETREDILLVAEELLQRRGYNAFSYHHIAVQLGIRTATIHYHFPGKESLGVALVQRFAQRFDAWTEAANATSDAWWRLQAFFQTYVDYLEAGSRVCPAGMLGAEFHAIPDKMRAEAQLYMGKIYRWLTETLICGRDQQCICYVGDAAHKALEIASALQGGLQISRLAGKQRMLDVVGQLRLELAGQKDSDLAPQSDRLNKT